MSKHMNASDIKFVMDHLNHPNLPMATRATLLTAWLMLENTPEELTGLQYIRDHYMSLLPKELHFLFNNEALTDFESIIHQVIHYNHLSKSQILSAFQAIIDQSVPNYKTAALLEGLRLKEESFVENATIYEFFRKNSYQFHTKLPVLLDMGTPYDGFNRSYFLQPFVAALLAACGIPTILHGVHEVSPKRGMNTHKLLLAANKNPFKSMNDIQSDLESPDIGWGYVDQSIFCPALHSLIPIRIDMVKRPVLATIEKWLQPFSANRTICLTGFTHSPYKQKTIDLVHGTNAYDQLILVRGVEGSTLLPFDRRTPFITSIDNHDPNMSFMSPKDYGFPETVFDNQTPLDSLSIGLSGLTGSNTQIKQYLCYQALAIGNAIGLTITIQDLNLIIESGQALHFWNAGCC